MDWKSIKESAREKMKGYCRACAQCDGKVCAGEVPGMGGTGTGEAFKENLKALAAVKLNLRTIHDAVKPSTGTEFFGHSFKTPIAAAPMTGSEYNAGGGLSEMEMISAVVNGAEAAGSHGWTGDGAVPAMYNDGLEAVKKAGRGIPIIKPRTDQEEIIKRIRQAEESGAIAVGVDVDGAGLVTMALKGQPVGPKTKEQLSQLVQSTSLPFIVKGIMTVDEAVKCAEAGVKAIVVSNHGGRVLDYTPGAAQVLPEIASELKGKVAIFADGGVRSGADALKLLALGADGVLVGRPLIIGAYGAGAEGVKFVIEKYTSELYAAMILTGCASINDISPEILF